MITEMLSSKPMVLYGNKQLVHLQTHMDVKYLISYCIDGGVKYFYLTIKDTEMIRQSLATDRSPKSSYWQYLYCKYVKDRRYMYEILIKKPTTYVVCDAIYHYCLEVKDRKGLWQWLAIHDYPYYHYLYCLNIKDRVIMRKALARSTKRDAPNLQYLYCRNVVDRDMMWKALISHRRITHNYSAVLSNYLLYCKPRRQVKEKLAYVERMLELERRVHAYGDFVQIPDTPGIIAT